MDTCRKDGKDGKITPVGGREGGSERFSGGIGIQTGRVGGKKSGQRQQQGQRPSVRPPRAEMALSYLWDRPQVPQRPEPREGWKGLRLDTSLGTGSHLVCSESRASNCEAVETPASCAQVAYSAILLPFTIGNTKSSLYLHFLLFISCCHYLESLKFTFSKSISGPSNGSNGVSYSTARVSHLNGWCSLGLQV